MKPKYYEALKKWLDKIVAEIQRKKGGKRFTKYANKNDSSSNDIELRMYQRIPVGYWPKGTFKANR